MEHKFLIKKVKINLLFIFFIESKMSQELGKTEDLLINITKDQSCNTKKKRKRIRTKALRFNLKHKVFA